ncbi:MAG: alcohol dehydrogenase catalytic domain-containing protein [Nitrososphaera sp.]
MEFSRTMQAAVFSGPNDLNVKVVTSPSEGVRTRVKACAVCGYDVRVFRHGHKKVRPPVILGHEICAELVDAVRTPRGDLSAGTRVAIYPQVPCLECRMCRLKQYNMCLSLRELGSSVNGGLAEYVQIPENLVKIGGLVQVPPGLTDEQAALLEPLACCINSVSRMDSQRIEKSDVVIIGDGPIALMHLQLLKQTQNRQVCVIGRIESRMQKAREMGADCVLKRQDDESTIQTIIEYFKGAYADSVVIATSNPVALELAQKVAGKNSLINLFAGMSHDNLPQIDANRVHYDQISVMGSFGCTPSLMSKAAQMVSEEKIDISSIVTHRYSLLEAERAFVDTENYSGLRGVINKF